MKTVAKVLLLLVLASPSPAQTTGVSGVNAQVISGQFSPNCGGDISLEAGPQILTLSVTASPGTVLVGGLANDTACGALPLSPTYSVDLELASTTLWFNDPAAPAPAFPFATTVTNSAGDFLLSVSTLLPATVFGMQWGLLGAQFASGVGTTQASKVTVSVVACAGTPLPELGEDTSVLVSLSTPFPFYGQSYSELFINMNGNLTFCSGSSDFTPSVADMLETLPRIAPCFDDFSPDDPGQGSIVFLDDGVRFCVEWREVRHFGLSCTGVNDRNTFAAGGTFASGDVTFSYDGLSLCSMGVGSLDQIVGITPGTTTGTSSPCIFGAPLLPNALDLATAGAVNPHAGATALTPLYEDFATSGPMDLANTGIDFLTFSPMGGAGVGPYALH